MIAKGSGAEQKGSAIDISGSTTEKTAILKLPCSHIPFFPSESGSAKMEALAWRWVL